MSSGETACDCLASKTHNQRPDLNAASLMNSFLANIGATLPVLAAPMAGGSTTPAMVTAAAAAGSVGFLAAGYKSGTEVAEQISSVRRMTPLFGVNLFAPNPVTVDRAAYREYVRRMQGEAERFGISVDATEPREDDDGWQEKVDLLTHDPVPIVSFTFGLPSPGTVRALKSAGSLVLLTVTSADEAEAAAQVGADALVVQAAAAGGHSGTFTPRVSPPALSLAHLLRSVRSVTRLPLIAAGGLSTPASIAEALTRGADAVTVGTALLLTRESGASQTYKSALRDPQFSRTVVTRAFTGRPARALRNDFTNRHTAVAPSGYPAIHHLTSPLRRAAATSGDPQRLHLWAGTGHMEIPTGDTQRVIVTLASGL